MCAAGSPFVFLRLNNCLLEAKDLKVKATVKMKAFFEISSGSADVITICETFKAFIKGEFYVPWSV